MYLNIMLRITHVHLHTYLENTGMLIATYRYTIYFSLLWKIYFCVINLITSHFLLETRLTFTFSPRFYEVEFIARISSGTL